MFFSIDDILLTSCRSGLKQCDLLLKTDANVTTLKVLLLDKTENHRCTAADCVTCTY